MEIPEDGDGIGVGWLNERLATSMRWPHGELASIRSERIGEEFGLSGRSYRLHAVTSSGKDRTLVAKFEAAEKLQRAITFRSANEAMLAGYLPASYASAVDASSDAGVILLEDISPAVQGDDLLGCSPAEADEMIAIVAHLHAATWIEPAATPTIVLDRWATRDWDPQRWADRLTRAAERYPDAFSPAVVDRLAGFVDEVAGAIDALSSGPAAWVHHDPHLDNMLWRPDGSAVLLDWSGAVIAPPAIDVAMLLFSLAFRDEALVDPDGLVVGYAAALRQHGHTADPEELTRAAALAVRPLLRGVVGWLGQPDEEDRPGRATALRDASASRVVAALRWIGD